MNIEENRLQTFTEWPSDTAVSPRRIAKAGFFSLGQNQTVQCFSCGLRISEWEYGDQVMAKHRLLSPQCPFVLDPAASGNIPKLSSTANLAENVSNLYQNERIRLMTFTDWPISEIVTPESLARAGFYYLKQSDKTKCAFCNGVVGSWEVGDNPDQEHRRHFPNCPFVRSIINSRLQGPNGESQQQSPGNLPIGNLNLVTHDNLLELGIQSHSAPKRPRYATYEARLASFALWPVDLIQTPEVLAQAGFYYEGRGDQVRCFHCDGGLRHWDPYDDPWTEHARWFPVCSFVLLVKGQDFVKACDVEQNVTSNLEQVAYKQNPTPPQRREVTERELQAQMVSPQSLAALEIGLHVGRVKQAIKEKLERTGTGFATADALIEATLNMQRDEEDLTSETQISRDVETILGEILDSTDNAPEESEPQPSLPCSSRNERKEEKAANKESKPLSLEEENRLLKEARLCKICMDIEVGIVFLPCGHLATCVNCAPNLQDCPVCRSAIKATVRTFLS